MNKYVYYLDSSSVKNKKVVILAENLKQSRKIIDVLYPDYQVCMFWPEYEPKNILN